MTTPATPAGDDLARLRLVSRLAVAYVLDSIAITRGDAQVLDTLLVSAIIQANIQEISRRADLHAAFAESDQPPPDDLRVPVSVNAVASSLRIPFETVRRRVRALVDAGMCRFVDGGVIVPAEVLSRPEYYVAGFRGFERLRAFYHQLNDLHLLRELPPPTAELSNSFPVRAASRLVGAYILRLVEAIGALGDLLDGLLLLEIFRSNVEHLAAEPPRSGELVADELRRPIAVLALAARAGVPYETVRRRIAALTARGVCVRVRGGLIVPAAKLADPRIPAALVDNAGNLQRLFAGLSQLGVLRVWDAQRARA